MNKSNFYVGLSTREAEFLKNTRRMGYLKSLTVMFASFSIIFLASNVYFEKKMVKISQPLELEIAKYSDLKIANQRTFDENKQAMIDKYSIGSIYSIEKNAPALDQSLDMFSQSINSNTLGPAFEVYGGIYEQLANAVDKSDDPELKKDLAYILEDGAITFDEYRNLRKKYDLDAIVDQYEAKKLRETIDKRENK